MWIVLGEQCVSHRRIAAGAIESAGHPLAFLAPFRSLARPLPLPLSCHLGRRSRGLTRWFKVNALSGRECEGKTHGRGAAQVGETLASVRSAFQRRSGREALVNRTHISGIPRAETHSL